MPRHEHALVVGKFAPLHRGHQLLLDHASRLAARLTVVVWSNPDFPEMPSEVRAGWIRELYPEAVVLVGTDGPANDAPDDVHRTYVGSLLDRHGLRPDLVASSEDYGPGLASHLGIAHEMVDRERTSVPMSGTMLRADVHAHRSGLDPRVYAHFVERVVFLGAESTGKSTLAERMAAELGTVYVPEYGRSYYAERAGDLGLDDYVTIALRHRQLEDEAALRANRYLLVDTNAISTMFFSHYYNRGCRPELVRLADECRSRYRQTIVCDDAIPFEQDGWRDNAEWRARMHGMVLHDLAVRGVPYVTVSGSLRQRVDQVTKILTGARPAPTERHDARGPKPRAQTEPPARATPRHE